MVPSSQRDGCDLSRRPRRPRFGHGAVSLLSRAALLLALGLPVGSTIVATPGHAAPASEAPDTGPVREFPDNLFGLTIVDAESAYATGYHGMIKVSHDGGTKWTTVPYNSSDLLRRVVSVGGGVAVAVSHRGDILKSDASGENWKVVYNVPATYLRDVSFATPQVGWVVGHDAVILHTTDGGATWKQETLSGYTLRDQPRFSGVVALSESRAIAVGEFGTIAETRDAGASWQTISVKMLPTMLSVAAKGNRGVAVGLTGTVAELNIPDDGPVELVSQKSTGPEHFLSVALSADGQTALIGGMSTLATWRDGTLTKADVDPKFDIEHSWIGGVAIGPDGRALAVGLMGSILRADSLTGQFTQQNLPDNDPGAVPTSGPAGNKQSAEGAAATQKVIQ